MRVLLIAVGLAHGGGRTVGLNLLRALPAVRPGMEIRALVPGGVGYEDVCRRAGIEFIAYPRARLYPVWRVWFDQVEVPRLAEAWAADVLFSINNHGPIRSPAPLVLLLQNAFYAYDVKAWPSILTLRQRASLLVKKYLFLWAAKRAAAVAVQTEVVAEQMCAGGAVDPDRVWIVPNAVTFEHLNGAAPDGPAAKLVRETGADRFKVLYLARYYPHKNVEAVLEVARRLRARGDDRFRFFITIAPDQHPRARQLLKRIQTERLGDLVINLGPIPLDQLGSVYRAVDILFFPTLLESFSGTYLEAMYYGLPVVTSNADFARSVCGAAAAYFDPTDADDAVRLLDQLAADPNLRYELKEKGRIQLGRHLRDWHDVAERAAQMLEAVYAAQSSAAGDRGISRM